MGEVMQTVLRKISVSAAGRIATEILFLSAAAKKDYSV